MRQPRESMIVVHRADRILVLHRSPRYDSYWHLVSGGAEAEETTREAAIRELREEIGLDAPDLVELDRRYSYPLSGEPEHRWSDFPPGTEDITVESFAVEAPAGWEPELNEEHDEYRWLPVEEAVQILRWPEAHEAVLAVTARIGP